MARKRISFGAVREAGLALPDVEEGTAYGAPALKVRGKLLACVATNKAAEPGSLVVRVGFDARTELIDADPATYYVKEHYLEYPVVLVRLARINADALRDLLRASRQFVIAEAGRRQSRAQRSPRRARVR